MKTNVQLNRNLTIKKIVTALSIGAFSMMFSQGTSVEKTFNIENGNLGILKAQVNKIKKSENVMPYTLVPMLTSMDRPMYRGGDVAFKNNFMNNLHRQYVSGTGLQYTTVSFLVNENGKISDVTAEGENETLNLASIIAVYKIKNGFTPANLDGTKMSAKLTYRIPVNL